MNKLREYTKDNPPKRGNALKIWSALSRHFDIKELHYNYGRNGSWAFSCDHQQDIGLSSDFGYFTGIIDDRVYVQQLVAPYATIWVDTLDKLSSHTNQNTDSNKDNHNAY